MIVEWGRLWRRDGAGCDGGEGQAVMGMGNTVEEGWDRL